MKYKVRILELCSVSIILSIPEKREGVDTWRALMRGHGSRVLHRCGFRRHFGKNQAVRRKKQRLRLCSKLFTEETGDLEKNKTQPT